MCEYCKFAKNGDCESVDIINAETQGLFGKYRFQVGITTPKELMLFACTESGAEWSTKEKIRYCPMCGREL